MPGRSPAFSFLAQARKPLPRHNGAKPKSSFQKKPGPADASQSPVRGGIFVGNQAGKIISELRQERYPPARANQYTQICLPGRFAVEGRQSLLPPEPDEELQQCLTGIVSDLFKTPTQ
jgi:hypothetical protein